MKEGITEKEKREVEMIIYEILEAMSGSVGGVALVKGYIPEEHKYRGIVVRDPLEVFVYAGVEKKPVYWNFWITDDGEEAHFEVKTKLNERWILHAERTIPLTE